MTQQLTIYPNVYKSLYDALTIPVALDAFPANVQGYLADMANLGLMVIDGGIVSRGRGFEPVEVQ
jgi:hypothetical protein